jgi:hypothetical protein
VLVKSSVGASGMFTYWIGNDDFDALFETGTLTTKLGYFYVPLLFHQRFHQRWYVEFGPMPGLRNKAVDIFETEVLDGDLEYKKDVDQEYKRLDFGFMAGVGYKLSKQTKSMAIGVNYYNGLVNVSKTSASSINNSSIFIYVKIPIGVKKSEAKGLKDGS